MKTEYKWYLILYMCDIKYRAFKFSSVDSFENIVMLNCSSKVNF